MKMLTACLTEYRIFDWNWFFFRKLSCLPASIVVVKKLKTIWTPDPFYGTCFYSSVQFSHSVVSDSLITARQASLSITNSRSLVKLMSMQSVMPSNHLILCFYSWKLVKCFTHYRLAYIYWTGHLWAFLFLENVPEWFILFSLLFFPSVLSFWKHYLDIGCARWVSPVRILHVNGLGSLLSSLLT